MKTRQNPNPFASPAEQGLRLRDLLPIRQAGPPVANLVASGLLFRKIQVDAPVQATISYVGYTLRDQIFVNDRRVAWRLPIMGLSGNFDFEIETTADPLAARIEVVVSRLLRLKRFTLTIDGRLIYEERPGEAQAIA
jgi:hypothetical protein